MFQFQSKGRKKLMSQFKGHWAGRILSYSEESQPFCSIQAFSRLHEAHPLWGRAICFMQSTDFHVNLIKKHPHRNS